MRIAEKAHAKVNLHLDVLNKRPDGYHNIGTIFQELGIHDLIEVEFRSQGDIELQGVDGLTSDVQDNLIYRAAMALKSYALQAGMAQDEELGANIYVQKELPMGAGLGGGSADAAATLKALNKLWRLNLSTETLELIGTPLGADVPFMINGGTQVARGIGEVLSPCEAPELDWVLIVTPSDFVSTATAYSELTPSGEKQFEDFIENYQPGTTPGSELYYNLFEKTVFPKHPQIAKLKDWMLENGAQEALMSGSGASVFGVFEKKETAEQAFSLVNKGFEGIRYKKVTFFLKNGLKA